MINVRSSHPQRNSAHVAQIKQWAVEAFQLPPEATVMVAELHCSEPGCPPLETVIAVLQPGQPPSQYKIHTAISDVTQHDVAVSVCQAAHAD